MKQLFTKVFTIAAIVFTVGGCVPRAPRGDFLVVPGERVGSIRIGMTLKEAAVIADRQFGPSEDTSDERQHGFCSPEGGGVCASDRGMHLEPGKAEGTVYMIVTDDKRFRTAGGNGVGSSREAYAKEFGPPTRSEVLVQYGVYIMFWDSIGLVVSVGLEEDAAVALGVYAK